MLGLIGCIVMAVFGIMTLVRGSMTISKNKVATGGPAYVAGVLLLLPLPLSFAVGVIIGITVGGDINRVRELQESGTLVLVELGIIVGCLVLALVIATANAHPPHQRRRSEDDYYAEDYDDYRRPRRAGPPIERDDYDDFADDRDPGPNPHDRFRD